MNTPTAPRPRRGFALARHGTPPPPPPPPRPRPHSHPPIPLVPQHSAHHSAAVCQVRPECRPNGGLHDRKHAPDSAPSELGFPCPLIPQQSVLIVHQQGHACFGHKLPCQIYWRGMSLSGSWHKGHSQHLQHPASQVVCKRFKNSQSFKFAGSGEPLSASPTHAGTSPQTIMPCVAQRALSAAYPARIPA